MLSAFLSAFRTPDLRKKLLFTAAILAPYRLGAVIPLPGGPPEAPGPRPAPLPGTDRPTRHRAAKVVLALVSALVDFGAEFPSAADAGQAAARAPVFIVGMHRSGTTLLEQRLDGHSDVKGVGELYDFTSQMRLATDHHCRGVIDATIVARARGIGRDADLAAVALCTAHPGLRPPRPPMVKSKRKRCRPNRNWSPCCSARSARHRMAVPLEEPRSRSAKRTLSRSMAIAA